MGELAPNHEPVIGLQVGADEHGAPLVSVRGELDMATIGSLEDAVAPILAADPRKLILDVAELRFADSSAIAKLVQWSTQVDELELRGAPALLRRVIDSMGLTRKLRLT